MRTTVTIEPDVEQLLKSAMDRTGESLKGVLNRAIRQGLILESAPPEAAPFRVKAFDMGCLAGVDLAQAHDWEHDTEVERFLHITAERARRDGATAAP